MAHLTAVAAAVPTLLLDPLRRPLNVIGVWRAEGERCLSLLDETTRGVERLVRHSVVGVVEPRVPYGCGTRVIPLCDQLMVRVI